MKDAKGHGSNARGGASAISKIIPSKPAGPGGDQTIGGPQDRSGQAHTQALADQHGIDTSHLVGYVPPSRPGDQSPTHNSQGHEWGSPAALADFKAEHGGPANKGQLARIARFRKAVGRGE